MKTIPMGNTDIMITPVGMGVLTIGNTQLNLPLAEGAKIVRYAYDKGIRLFDTAQFYETYSYIREAFRDIDMSSNNPDRPVIASKSLVLSYGEMEDAIQEPLIFSSFTRSGRIPTLTKEQEHGSVFWITKRRELSEPLAFQLIMWMLLTGWRIFRIAT